VGFCFGFEFSGLGAAVAVLGIVIFPPNFNYTIERQVFKMKSKVKCPCGKPIEIEEVPKRPWRGNYSFRPHCSDFSCFLYSANRWFDDKREAERAWKKRFDM
jgi:hypothetical protein